MTQIPIYQETGTECTETSVKRALGILKHFGFNESNNIRGFLEFSVGEGLCTQQQVDNAHQEYLKNLLSR
jgi:hypothetical protein